jgi:hypothetical protein
MLFIIKLLQGAEGGNCVHFGGEGVGVHLFGGENDALVEASHARIMRWRLVMIGTRCQCFFAPRDW